jgi:hypothetical protein
MAKEGVMESQEIMITDEQNVSKKGFGVTPRDGSTSGSILRLMSEFYGHPGGNFPTFDEVDAVAKFLEKSSMMKSLASVIGQKVDENLKKMIQEKEILEIKSRDGLDNVFFNVHVYKKRMRISLETLLIEANYRAKIEGRTAYVHVVGLGLGVWKVISVQDGIFVSIVADILAEVALDFISDLDFSWIPVKKCGPAGEGDKFPGTEITLHFSMRDPFAQLPQGNEDKLVVASWAWDGNSFPGNEYWASCLTSSSDPAAACCSQIVEIQNPYINPKLCGANLHVASRKDGIVTLKEYARRACEVA